MYLKEKIAIFIVFLFTCIGLSYFYMDYTLTRHLDSVFLFEVLASINTNGIPTSSSVASWPEIITTLAMEPNLVCAMAFDNSVLPAYNVLENHSYVALYPMALIGSLTGEEFLICLMNALCHLGPIFICYIFLRIYRVSSLVSLFFSVTLLFFPPLALSATGDYYLDRFYMPFMLCFLFLCYTKASKSSLNKKEFFLILTIGITAASFTERAAIMVICSCIFFLALVPSVRKNKNLLVLLLSLAISILVYLILYFTIVYQGISNGGSVVNNVIINPDALKIRLADPKVMTLVVTNLAFLGWLCLAAGWRYILLVLGAIVPNIVVSIGGAELNGWTTHYHAMYIPFVIFVAAIGFKNILSLVKSNTLKAISALSVTTATIFLTFFYDPFSAAWGRETNKFSNYIGSIVYTYYALPEHSSVRAQTHWQSILAQKIPSNTKVSSIEGVMPALYKNRQVFLYPYAMAAADYLVLSGFTENGVPKSIFGATNYLNSEELNTCLANKAKSLGFQFQEEIPAIGVLIFKR